jgi:Zn-dependent protease/CBS domain-containing protein
MFGRSFKLFGIYGFTVRLDASWFLLGILVTWSLGGAHGFFRTLAPHLAPATAWAMGAVGAVGLLLSIVAHELSHAVVARRFGLPIRGITLFVFGGVAEMSEEPRSPGAELWMAAAGPAASVVLAVAFLGLGALSGWLRWPAAVSGILAYMAWINGAVALFNLIPAFPLDGGRILRALLWRARHDFAEATDVTSRIGSAFGLVMMAGGGIVAIAGYLVDGLWFFFIGLFVRGAAIGSRRQSLMTRMLAGEHVRDYMAHDPVVVPRQASVREFVEQYVYRYPHDVFPVNQDDRLAGCVSVRTVKGLPHSEWERMTVGALAEPCGTTNTVGPEDDVLATLKTMRRTGHPRMLVVDHGDLIGMIAAKDLVKALAIKSELNS